PPPLLFARRGVRLHSFPSERPRGWSAKRRSWKYRTLRRGRPEGRTRATWRSIAAVFGVRGRAFRRRPETPPSVSEPVAGGRSAPGRVPGAARAPCLRGTERGHRTPLRLRTPPETPSIEQGLGIY